MVLGNWTDTQKKMKLDHLLTSYKRINSKWIKDLNVRLDAVKILEENRGNKILEISRSNIFSDILPWAGKTKEKITHGTTSN